MRLSTMAVLVGAAGVLAGCELGSCSSGSGEVENPAYRPGCRGSSCPRQCIDPELIGRDGGRWAGGGADVGVSGRDENCWAAIDPPDTTGEPQFPRGATMAQCAESVEYLYAARICQQHDCGPGSGVDCLLGVDDNCNGCIDEDYDCGRLTGHCRECGGHPWPADSYEAKPSAYTFGPNDMWTALATGRDCEGPDGCVNDVFEARYICIEGQPRLQVYSVLLNRSPSQCLLGQHDDGPPTMNGRRVCGVADSARWLIQQLNACDNDRTALTVQASQGVDGLQVTVRTGESRDPRVAPVHSLRQYQNQVAAIMQCMASAHADANRFGTGDDVNQDGILDGCQDADGDGVLDDDDSCPHEPNADQDDRDDDEIGDACDNCPVRQNRDQADNDNDGIGDDCACDDDVDGDLQRCLEEGIGDEVQCEALANDCTFWPAQFVDAVRAQGFYDEEFDPEPLNPEMWENMVVPGVAICAGGRRICFPKHLTEILSGGIAAAALGPPDEPPVVWSVPNGMASADAGALAMAAHVCTAEMEQLGAELKPNENPMVPNRYDRNGDSIEDSDYSLESFEACQEDVLQRMADGHIPSFEDPRGFRGSSPSRVGAWRVGRMAERMVYESSEWVGRGDCNMNVRYGTVVTYLDGTSFQRYGEDDIQCEGRDYSPMPDFIADAVYGKTMCQGWDVKLLRTYGKNWWHGSHQPPYWSPGRQLKQKDQKDRYSHHQEQMRDYAGNRGRCTVGFLPVWYPPAIFVHIVEGRWERNLDGFRANAPPRILNALRPIDERHRFRLVEDPRDVGPGDVADQASYENWRHKKIWMKWSTSPFRKTPGVWDDGPAFQACRGTPEQVTLCTAASRSLVINTDNLRQAMDPEYRRQTDDWIDGGAYSVVTRPYITPREALLFNTLCAEYVALVLSGSLAPDADFAHLCDMFENEGPER